MTAVERNEAVTQVVGRWCAVMEPPPRMTAGDWANERRYLSPESSSNPGRYSSDMTPFAVEPMDTVNDPTCTGTVMMVASQLGKTEIINNLVGYFIDIEPSPMLMVQPTIEMGESWSKERLAPMLRDCPTLKNNVHDAKSRDSGNTILHKTFPGGNLAIAGANAPSGLASRPRRVVLLDEVDRFPPSAGSEGDPCALAIRRTETFWNAVVFMTSTPTVKGRSRVENEFEQSSQGRWNVPCPKCAEKQSLKWSQVRHEDDADEDAWYQCEICESHWTDEQRRVAIRQGEWVHEFPARTLKGYHLNGISSLFRHKKGYDSRLHQMVMERNKAKKGGTETLKTWVNTFLAETWEEDGEGVEWQPLMDRRENWGDFPEGGLCVTAGVDIQGDRVELEYVAHGIDEESWSIGYEVIIGDFNRPETKAELNEALGKTWRHPISGMQINVAAACVDSGHKTKSVYAFTRPRQMRKIYAVKGRGGPGMPIVSRPTKQGVERALLFAVGTDTAKEIVYSRLVNSDLGAGYMHFPSDRTEDYFRQLTSEKRVTRWKGGVPFAKFENLSKARNEALDVRCYANAALAILRPNWKKLAESVGTAEEEREEEKEKEKEKATVKKERRKSRCGGYNPNKW